MNHEYIAPALVHNNKIELLNETIDERYRQKGYQINFLTFLDSKPFGVDIKPNDILLKSDITFKQLLTPIGVDNDGETIHNYPASEWISQRLGEFEELVVCGFHAYDCVTKVAEYFYNINPNTMIDLELTDLFSELSNRFYFKKDNYNPANNLVYNGALLSYISHKHADKINTSVRNLLSKEFKYRLNRPVFQYKKFKPDFTVITALQHLNKDNFKENKLLLLMILSQITPKTFKKTLTKTENER